MRQGVRHQDCNILINFSSTERERERERESESTFFYFSRDSPAAKSAGETKLPTRERERRTASSWTEVAEANRPGTIPHTHTHRKRVSFFDPKEKKN
jgi:hypothetical protein